MTFRRLLAGWLPRSGDRPSPARRLALEMLEAREVPAVTLRDVPDTDAPNNVPLFIPVTPTNTPAGAVSYTATTNNPGVAAQIITGGPSLKLDVTGTAANGQPFSGTLTIKLFTDVAPRATGTIIQLANEGFYNGKLFHRVLDGFVAQGGSPNGDGIGGSSLPDVPDEFNRDFTFASPGIVAMANAKDDNNNSQFFITDIDTPLSQRPQFLNFNHSIVGLLTEGFETFQNIMTTPVTSAGGEKSRPVNPVTITKAAVFEDTENALVRVTPSAGVTGNVAVTVTGSDGSGQDGVETFNVNVLPVNVGQNLEPVNSRAILNPVPNPAVPRDGTGSFTLTGTDIDNDKLTFAVGTPDDLFGQPANAAVSVDQATGRVTVTPNPGFTGDIQLLVGVRDQTDRAGDPNDPGNFDTQPVTVSVRAPATVTGTLTASRTTVGLNQPVLLKAAFAGDGRPATGTAQFFANGTQIGSSQLIDGEARFTATFPAAGDQSVQAKFTPADALFLAGETTPLQVTVSTEVPAAVTLSATGAEPGQPPRVRVTTQDGAEKFNFLAFEENFTGGVRVATADVTGDGQDDVVAVPRFGGAPLIRVFDGQTGSLANEVMVFEDTFRGGLYLDVGDGFELGYSQILVGAGFTGGPRVTLYDAVQNKVLLNYFADDPAFRGGITVNMSDLQGGTKQFIITGVGKGGGPIVSVYDALRTDGFPVPDKRGSFVAGDINDRSGIRVGAGGLIDGTRRNILVGPFEPDSAPLDRSFDPVAQGIFVDGSGS